jgi:lipoate-protein ligase A
MSETWRLILDHDLSGTRNMARDTAMLEAVAGALAPPTLRLYGWRPPCLTLGRHQPPDVVDLEFCRREGIDVVRRPTGGRALLHHHELTYAVAAPRGGGPLPRALQEAYRALCHPLVEAMRELGIDAELTGGEVNLQLPGPRSAAPCFEAPAGGEVVVRGRKLIGSAMRAHGGAILQHGAILLDWDDRLQAGSMGVRDAASLRRAVTTLRHELGHPIERPALESHLVEVLGRDLGVTYEPGSVTDVERERQAELEADFCALT